MKNNKITEKLPESKTEKKEEREYYKRLREYAEIAKAEEDSGESKTEKERDFKGKFYYDYYIEKDSEDEIMNNNYLQIKLKYNVKTQECVIEHSNIKKDQITNILEDFISSEKGRGEDKRKANEKDIYSFNIKWFPSNDLITVSSDTGNYGLQLGILMHIFANFDKVCKDI